MSCRQRTLFALLWVSASHVTLCYAAACLRAADAPRGGVGGVVALLLS